MDIRKLIEQNEGPLMKSNCQWCGLEICHTQERYRIAGNACRKCRRSFHLWSSHQISANELSAQIAAKRVFPDEELWYTIKGTYFVDMKTKTAEKLD